MIKSDETPDREDVKRLKPTPDTLRELYFKSGNQCAFKDCKKLIMDSDGDYIGQLCHIQAAKTGGQRFNPDMSNEDRRNVSNLLLLCYEHHKKTDDEVKFPVGSLQQMKADHEAKFTNIADKIADEITDQSGVEVATNCETLATMSEVLNLGYEAEDLQCAISDMKWVFGQLISLPKRTRQLLSLIVSRLPEQRKPKRFWRDYRYGEHVLLFVLSEVSNIEEVKLQRHIELMEGYGLVSFWEHSWDFEARVTVRDFPEGFIAFADILEFSKRTGVSLNKIFVDLRFDVFDSPQ